MSKQWPKPFEVTDLFPGRSEIEVAELLADHFNKISQEFVPLDMEKDIPNTYEKELPTLQPHEVAIRLKKFKNPNQWYGGIYSQTS